MKTAERINPETFVALQGFQGRRFRKDGEFIEVTRAEGDPRDRYFGVHYDASQGLARQFLYANLRQDGTLAVELPSNGFEKDISGHFLTVGPWSDVLDRLNFVKDRLLQMSPENEVFGVFGKPKGPGS